MKLRWILQECVPVRVPVSAKFRSPFYALCTPESGCPAHGLGDGADEDGKKHEPSAGHESLEEMQDRCCAKKSGEQDGCPFGDVVVVV